MRCLCALSMFPFHAVGTQVRANLSGGSVSKESTRCLGENQERWFACLRRSSRPRSHRDAATIRRPPVQAAANRVAPVRVAAEVQAVRPPPAARPATPGAHRQSVERAAPLSVAMAPAATEVLLAAL